MWQIISKDAAAQYARMAIGSIDDLWYDTTLGIIETYCGWSNLEEAVDITETMHGNNSPILIVKAPIVSVTSISVDGTIISPTLYKYNWNKIYMTNNSDRTSLSVFQRGIMNVVVSYRVGGISSLPEHYQDALKATMLLCIKEMVAVPRNEGSDQTLRKYRPDRTMMPEETLKNYGIHGKIMGIVKAQLPGRIKVA